MAAVRVFCDFDDTLLQGDSILLWLRFYYRQRPRRRVFLLANWTGLALWGLRLLSSAGLKRVLLWPMAFEPPEELDRLAREFMRAEVGRHFHRRMLERLWTHHRLGHEVVVISASATFYLRHLVLWLPFAEVLGTEMIFPRKGVRFPRFVRGNLKAENKVRLLRELGCLEGDWSFAYSDHPSDLPMLRAAAFPFGVLPSLPLLRKVREEGWPVMDWPRPPGWRLKAAKLRLLVLAAGAWFATGSERLFAGKGRFLLESAAFERERGALREAVAARYAGEAREEALRAVVGAAEAK